MLRVAVKPAQHDVTFTRKIEIFQLLRGKIDEHTNHCCMKCFRPFDRDVRERVKVDFHCRVNFTCVQT